ncbi:uncharacterized protein L3040_005075 [Drepanopeziza brunnea f. sp. 'multigermtubi']|uniref:uncharacterized protein n=1 Tax=Drepanopeziza brunnea f. sp. 'multigermtubi' TaxID=698441 RepID=UPI002393DE06|nr:hypothetical protein L3040_005075 [Drepanopeziza brunnea f. sp. 'multigermtubi']
MFSTSILGAVLGAASLCTAAHPGSHPFAHRIHARQQPDYGTAADPDTTEEVNPFLGKSYYVNPAYADKLEETISAFLAQNDTLNAARTRTAQSIGTFVWVTSVAGLGDLDMTIKYARAVQHQTKQKQIVSLVLYNLPDRDCSGGESGGEFSSAANGLELYKKTFVDPYAEKLMAAPDLDFAVIMEPDSMGNAITNMNVPFCASAAPIYEEGLAYAISKLQASHVHLYVDAANGGWLGWPDSLPKVAAQFAKVLDLANQNSTKEVKIRGFSTNVSNFNPYIATTRPSYTEFSTSYDELNYAKSLAPYLTSASLPTKFIIDQGRSGLQGTRTSWGDWCNAKAGFGIRPTTDTNSTLVDSIVWAKPGGESDGACGPALDGQTGPAAGMWWNEYTMDLVKNANPPLTPTYPSCHASRK